MKNCISLLNLLNLCNQLIQLYGFKLEHIVASNNFKWFDGYSERTDF